MHCYDEINMSLLWDVQPEPELEMKSIHMQK
jgi:hypothetical protein